MKPNGTFRVFVCAAFVFCGLVCAGEAVIQPAASAGGQPQQSISTAQAVALLTQEAERGNAAALVTLGSMYERGVGTSRDFAKAFECFSKAAAAGLAEGYYNTGICYEVGMGTTGSADPENARRAFEHFEKAAELGLSQGLYKLALVYTTGRGTDKNEAWGVELLGRAAAGGHAGAANDLGVVYFEGTLGVGRDTARAFEWFTRSAELGNGEAMKNLAVFYRDGVDRAADPGQELKWYALARLAGYPAGPLNVAIEEVKRKMTGEDVARIEAEAQAWVKAFQERQQAQPAAAQQ